MLSGERLPSSICSSTDNGMPESELSSGKVTPNF
nr:MAG TPA: hypothetical protein [Caudoviricetes sp.]